jgi:soluble lytic murein transglycosylase-like protein
LAGGALLFMPGIPMQRGVVTGQVAVAAEANVQRENAPAEQRTGQTSDTSHTPVPAPSTEALTPRMRGALDYASKRYRVSQDALEPVFMAVQKTAREFMVDPLLIVAVIAVESRFNPLSQSESGAQGLMQLIPRYHRDKLPAGAGKLPFFDPVINVRVGTMALRDFIRRGGGIVAGLQLFSGETADPGQSYSARVLAEKDRLEFASRRAHPGAA